MADLLVHFASAYAPGRRLRDDRTRALLYAGVCLPDALYKGLLYLCGADNWACEATHAPLALIAFCYVGAMLFEEPWRPRAFGALLAGSWLHVLVDVAKNYLGTGVIPWAFPFSMDLIELGWYYPDETVFLMVPALLLIVGTELLFKLLSPHRRRRSPE